MRTNGQQGFTLLELLVTVTILGILAGIGLPQYASYRDRAEKASIISDGRSLFRGFLMFYIENNGFPCAPGECTGPDADLNFDPLTFHPLNDATLMGGEKLDFSIMLPKLKAQLRGGQVDLFDSPDDMGDDQEFYLVLTWAKNPDIKFVIAQGDNVEYAPADGSTSVDSGNWIDGVFTTRAGALVGL